MTIQLVSQFGVDFIAHSEGLKLKAYKCPAGVWTIGYGHTSAIGAPEVYPGMVITAEQAADILQDDLAKVDQSIRAYVKVSLSQGQSDALTAFVFNVGAEHFRTSTLLRRLNKRDYDSVPAQLLRWTHSNGKVIDGLVTRRTAEVSLWNGSVRHLPTSPIPQRVDAPKVSLKPTTGHVVSAGGGALTASLPDVLPQLLQHVSLPTIEHYTAAAIIAVGLFVAGILTDRFIITRREHNNDVRVLDQEQG